VTSSASPASNHDRETADWLVPGAAAAAIDLNVALRLCSN